MKVSEALQARKSVRAFLPDPVPDDVIREVLELAARAPSGGNLQPWRIYVLSPDAANRLRNEMESYVAEHPGGESDLEYSIYPKGLKEPYRTNRFGIGEAMYEKLGIAREDKTARLMWMANNFQFFGAPNAFFCFVDKQMGPPQWSDLGMYLQSVMLLFQERGFDTCPQEAWAIYPHKIREFCGAPEEEMLFCGMAIGKMDKSHKVNEVESARMPLEAFTRFVD